MEETVAKKSEASRALDGHMNVPQLIRFVVPTIITVVFACLYGIIDGIFVSNVGGNAAFAAINLIAPLFLIFSSFGMMFGTGGNAIVSKTRGEGKLEEAQSIFSTLTLTVVILGVAITLFLELFLDDVLLALGATEEMFPLCMIYGRIISPFIVCYLLQFYFQNMLVTAGKGVLGFVMTLAAGCCNIIGDVILVGFLSKTPEQAIAGAAVSTVCGLIVGGGIPLFYFLFKNSSFLRIVKPKLSIKVILRTCANGVAEFLTNISGALMSTVFNGLLLYIVGQMGVAAYGSIGYMNTIFTAVFMGYSIGIAPVIAYKYGEGDTKELKYLFRVSLVLMGIASVAMVVLGEIVARPMAQIFSAGNEQLVRMTIVGFQIYSISFLFKGINTFGSAFFTALNNGVASGVLSWLRAFLFSIVTVLILPIIFYIKYGQDTALLGIWWSVNYSEFLALIVTVAFMFVLRKKYQY